MSTTDKRATEVARRTGIAADRTVGEIRGDLAWHSAIWCQLSLPYRVKPNQVVFERTNGGRTLEVLAKPGMMPRGLYDRRFLLWMSNAAHEQQSRQLVLDNTDIVEFFRSVTGGEANRTRLSTRERDRIESAVRRLFGAHLTIVDRTDPQRERGGAMRIVSQYDLWLGGDTSTQALWDSSVTLSEEYADSIRGHAVPVDRALLRAMGKSAEAIDVATWLPWRVHPSVLHAPTRISWAALLDQFGQQNSRVRDARLSLKKHIEEVAAFYETAGQAPFASTTEHGVRLRPVELLPGVRPKKVIAFKPTPVIKL